MLYFIAPSLVGAGAQLVLPSSWSTDMLSPSASGATEAQACFSGVRPERLKHRHAFPECVRSD